MYTSVPPSIYIDEEVMLETQYRCTCNSFGTIQLQQRLLETLWRCICRSFGSFPCNRTFRCTWILLNLQKFCIVSDESMFRLPLNVVFGGLLTPSWPWNDVLGDLLTPSWPWNGVLGALGRQKKVQFSTRLYVLSTI